MTPERIIEIRDEHLPSQGDPFDCLAFGLAIAAEERRAALTEAAEMLDRAKQPAAALGVIIMRDKG